MPPDSSIPFRNPSHCTVSLRRSCRKSMFVSAPLACMADKGQHDTSEGMYADMSLWVSNKSVHKYGEEVRIWTSYRNPYHTSSGMTLVPLLGWSCTLGTAIPQVG